MVLWETFIYNEEKFPSQVGPDIAVPWRVIPGDLSFPGFALSRCPPCLWIEYKFKFKFKFVVVVFAFKKSITSFLGKI